ncbi:MAG: prepilin-type N-terminal cleavage/methylation domain-containing protein [Rubrivivax sp.]|nr:MAG: prepilin-type N-terminal cleavage/methylation domain-containing protein [Rubrivivax sp.]
MVKSLFIPHRSPPRRRPTKGFTLVELMVVVAISAILIAMAVPMFTDYVSRQAINAQVSALASSIRIARSEALKRSMPVTLCPSANPDAAQPTCAISADGTLGWATGWLMFTDWGIRKTFEPATDTVIARQSAFSDSGGITPTGGATYALTFLPNGLALNDQGGFVFKARGAATDESLQKTMCVSAQGSTRIVKGGSC